MLSAKTSRLPGGLVRSQRAHLRPVLVQSMKGFGDDTKTDTAAANVKLSKRGTPVTRQGALSKEELKKQEERYEAMKVAQEAQQQAEQERRAEANEIREVPEVVSERMIKRIVLFTGVPLTIAFGFFPMFYYLKVVQHIDIPVYVVYIASVIGFGGSAMGITYGIMSSSWDPQREGSFWGWQEFQANLPVLLDRFRK